MLRIPQSPVDTLLQRLVEIRIVLRIPHSPVDTLRQRLVEIRIVLRIAQSRVDTVCSHVVEISQLSNNLGVSFRITAGLGSSIDFLSPFGRRLIAAILCGLNVCSYDRGESGARAEPATHYVLNCTRGGGEGCPPALTVNPSKGSDISRWRTVKGISHFYYVFLQT